MNGSWAWNTFLPTDEESSQFLLGLSPRVGIFFPYIRLDVCSFVLFKQIYHMASGQSHCQICPLQVGDRILGSAAAQDG